MREEKEPNEGLVKDLAEARQRLAALEAERQVATRERQQLIKAHAAQLDWVNKQLQQAKLAQKQAEEMLQQAQERLGHQLDELAALNLIAQTLAGNDLSVTLPLVAATIAYLFNAHSTFIDLFSPTDLNTIPLVQYPDRADQAEVTPLPLPAEVKTVLQETKQAVIIPATSTGTLAETLQAQGFSCLMLVPLIARGETIGVIQIIATQPGRHFNRTEIALAETTASQVAGAIEATRLFTEERFQRQVAESLRDVSTLLVSHLDLEIVFEKIMEHLDQVIENDGGAIFLQEGEELVLTAGLGPAAKAHLGERISLSSLNPGVRAFNQRRTLIINRGEQEAHWLAWPEADTIHTWVGIPLFVGEQAIGLLTIDSFKPRVYREEELQILQIFANQAAIAIQNGRLFNALKASEERYRAVVQDQTEVVVRFLPDGRLSFVNDTCCRFLGQPREKLIGQSLGPYIFSEDREAVADHFIAQRHKAVFDPVEHRIVAAGGEVRWLQWNTRSITDDQGQIIEYQGVGRDITERKHLEEQLRQSQKMQALGQLAGGIAHHFNNLLTTIIGFVTLAQDTLPDQHPAAQDLERVLNTAHHAAELTQQLLTFTRTRPIQPKVAQLNELISNLVDILRRALGERIQLITRLAPDLEPTRIDAGQFEQLLVNLVVNAREAMPEGGQIILETANVTVTEMEISTPDVIPPGHYIRLSITDTGMGMNEEIQSHIFEPFFTTKEVGQGTGLGLSTCFGIIKQHDGYISVTSSPGRGSIFTLFFPQLEKEAGLLPLTGHPDQQIWPTILLVEDDPSVREMVARALRQQEYLVLEAGNGAEALWLVSQRPEIQLDLLLTDVVMPHLSGPELAIKLRHRYPNLKTLVMTGYTDEVLHTQYLPEVADIFLAKPFSLSKMLEAVQHLLHSLVVLF